LRAAASRNRTVQFRSQQQLTPQTPGTIRDAERPLDLVSRQFVARLIADGKLTHRHKPGSKHRIISITEINHPEHRR